MRSDKAHWPTPEAVVDMGGLDRKNGTMKCRFIMTVKPVTRSGLFGSLLDYICRLF